MIKKAFVLFLLLSTTFAKEPKKISLNQAHNFFTNNNGLFINTDTKHSYLQTSILFSININLENYHKMKKLLPRYDTPLILFCNQNCSSIKEVSNYLYLDGYKEIYFFPFYKEWVRNNLPIIGKKKKCLDTPYIPKAKPTKINGVTIYKGIDKYMIDQFWLADKIQTNTLNKNIQLVDIRNKNEYDKGHIKKAINTVWDSRNKSLDYKQFDKNKITILYCNTGMQSADAITSIPKKLRNNIFYFDANIECIEDSCTIHANENL
jgi:rhodanese-related sulfurtransferase